MYSDSFYKNDYEEEYNLQDSFFKKKNIIIFTLLLIVIVLVIILLTKDKGNSENNFFFSINGLDNINVYLNEVYIDDGFFAFDDEGNDLKNYVRINNNVDTTKIGIYNIDYILKYKGITKKLQRTVNVIANDLSQYIMLLNGNATTYVRLNEKYNDLGCNVYDSIANNQTDDGNDIEGNNYADRVIVTSNVDTSNIGKYFVNYKFNFGNLSKQLEREVIVYELKYDFIISPSNSTSGSVEIVLGIDNSANYAYTLLPNGSISSNKIIRYQVDTNGLYSFYLHDIYGNVINEQIKVDNVIRDYSCNAIIDSSGTSISITGSRIGDVNEYTYILDEKEYVSNLSTYQLNYKSVSKAKAKLKINNYFKEIDCSINDNLIYKFKYDEFNTKEYMQCGTYSSADRVKLETELFRSVGEAGYGTRAGVVAAARYLVGALDYKINYLGPKTVNETLGRYSKRGLNIANENGWGCRVSGWTQGIDCTNFASWAFTNGGVSLGGVYSLKNTYPSSSVNLQIKAGDLMLSPCNKSVCKSNFQHVGIVIGVDDNYIYVAESTSGTINAVVVTKFDKYNLSASKFSVVKLYNYENEGNYTSMWVS